MLFDLIHTDDAEPI